MKLRELAERLGCELRGDGEVEIAGVAGHRAGGPRATSPSSPTRATPPTSPPRGPARSILAPGHEAPAALPRLRQPLPRLRARGGAPPAARAARRPGCTRPRRWTPRRVLGAGVHVGALAVVGARRARRRALRRSTRTSCSTRASRWARTACSTRACRCASAAGSASRVVVQNGAVIGGDGFGFARDREGRYHKFPQVGIVVVEDDVEIGALTADRPGGARRDPHRPRHEARQPRAGRPLGHDRRGHGARRPGRHRGQHAHRQPGHPGRAGRRRRPPHDRRRRDRHRPDGHPRLGREGRRRLGLPRDREPRLAQVERGLRPAARAAEAPARAGAEGRVAARPAARPR